MLIPTWLLILIVVVVISALWPSLWGEIGTLVIAVSILLALVSWLIWVMTVEGIRTSLWLHEIRVRAAATPQAAEKLRRDFADAIGLYSKLRVFPAQIIGAEEAAVIDLRRESQADSRRSLAGPTSRDQT
jgi:hypothetical protein